GLFETILVDNQTIYAWPEHYARLSAGLNRLGLPEVAPKDLLARLNAAARCTGGVSVAKILITAGCGPRGYVRSENPALTIRVWANLLPKLNSAPLSVGIAAHPISAMPYLAGLKTLNRLDQVLAANPVRQDIDEQLLTDHQNRVVCATNSNFFWREGEQWFTPPITEGGIEGTRRALWICRLGARQQHAALGRLALAEQAFLCNAVNVYRPIAHLQGRALTEASPPQSAALVAVNGGYQFHETAASFDCLHADADNHLKQNCWSKIRGMNP
ncbi:MAG TPA: hypothetical protein ENM98_05300, partial [Halothiobacillaceae bacterium]|nr:hypothetical protein [Halothiobacillaceae bacterium]